MTPVKHQASWEQVEKGTVWAVGAVVRPTAVDQQCGFLIVLRLQTMDMLLSVRETRLRRDLIGVYGIPYG